MTLNKREVIGVLFGGQSSEHEISLRSTVYVLKNIPEKYDILPIGIDREGVFKSLTGVWNSASFREVTTDDLSLIVQGKVPARFAHLDIKNKVSYILPHQRSAVEHSFSSLSSLRCLNLEVDIFFPVLHGPNGEDGRFQGLFELSHIAYVGCNMRASVVGIDKDLQKRLAREGGISVAKYEAIDREMWDDNKKKSLETIEKNIGYPCFVKPNALGSAVGGGLAHNQEELFAAIQNAFAFDEKILVEEKMQGTEVECAFLGTPYRPRVTDAGEIAPKQFYSYEEKYASSSPAELYVPARLSPERMAELKKAAVRVAQLMGIEGLSRIDFWNCTKTGRFIFNEYNSLPGLTSISMFPKLWEYSGVVGEIWIEELLQQAKVRQARWDKLQYGITAN